MEDINLRCYYHKEFLYDLKQALLRWLAQAAARQRGSRRVRRDRRCADRSRRAGRACQGRLHLERCQLARCFYDTILNDSRMQETLDPTTNPGSGQGNLKPSCSRMVPGEPRPPRLFHRAVSWSWPSCSERTASSSPSVRTTLPKSAPRSSRPSRASSSAPAHSAVALGSASRADTQRMLRTTPPSTRTAAPFVPLAADRLLDDLAIVRELDGSMPMYGDGAPNG